MNWSHVFEISLGAVLAFIFGFFLQWWMVHRQECFQKQLLERQLSFMEKLEKERAANDAKLDEARAALMRSVIGHHNTILQQISREERNHQALLHSRDNFEARQRAKQP
jgi:hypothetical protein